MSFKIGCFSSFNTSRIFAAVVETAQLLPVCVFSHDLCS